MRDKWEAMMLLRVTEGEMSQCLFMCVTVIGARTEEQLNRLLELHEWCLRGGGGNKSKLREAEDKAPAGMILISEVKEFRFLGSNAIRKI